MRRARTTYHRTLDVLRVVHSRLFRSAALLAPGPAAAVERALPGGDVLVGDGVAGGLRFPARAVGVTKAHSRLLLSGVLEVPVQEALRRHIAPGDVVWDAGAHIGFFTLLAARLAGPSGRVVAYEPVPANAHVIVSAAASNGLADRVEVREQAVGRVSRTEPLLVIGESGWSHLASRGNVAGVSERRLTDVVALDDVHGPPPAVIKLDVEGSEGDVLRGAERLLREARPVLVIELHDTNDEVCDLLDAAGYRAENLEGPEPVRSAGPIRILALPGR